MPNWCENELVVKGKREEVDAFIKKAKGRNGALDMNKFIPYPTEYKKMDKVAKEYEKAHPNDWENIPKDGYNQGGYEWCNENWGTKWNFCEVGMSKPDDYKNGNRRVEYAFETAWSPPMPVIKAMSKKFPNLSFTLKYYEGGMAFSGRVVFLGGEKIEEKHNDDYRGGRGG